MSNFKIFLDFDFYSKVHLQTLQGALLNADLCNLRLTVTLLLTHMFANSKLTNLKIQRAKMKLSKCVALFVQLHNWITEIFDKNGFNYSINVRIVQSLPEVSRQ